MRGEESEPSRPYLIRKEIPPRARRRGVPLQGLGVGVRNTSACAEKRVARPAGVDRAWKYLRVRGEELFTVPTKILSLEIPPRARRRVLVVIRWLLWLGNTSACAEKRKTSPNPNGPNGKYLRVRGEEWPWCHMAAALKEIPPRARRRAAWFAACGGWVGNTSACAEKRSSHPGH